MMKKLMIMRLGIVFVSLQAGLALSTPNPDTGPGCGLGKVLWSGYKSQKNIAPQVMMGTTNITGLHPFAISSGTSGCTNDGRIWTEQKATMFASINFENLSQEMAQGQGEHLASLATLMGVPAEHSAEFFAMTQERYTSLIQAGETSPTAMVKALYDAMARHPILARLYVLR